MLTWRVERARVLRFFFAIYLLAMVGDVPRADGDRREHRAASLRVDSADGARLLAAALAAAVDLRRASSRSRVAWNVSPLAWSLFKNGGDVTAQAKTWSSAISYLQANLEPSYRVEAVDTATHSAAVYLADARIPLARGWYRQDDFPQNEVLYDQLGPKTYLGWLHGLGVRYVVLAARDARLQLAGRGRARARAGGSSSQRVFHTRELSIFRVPHARVDHHRAGIARASRR